MSETLATVSFERPSAGGERADALPTVVDGLAIWFDGRLDNRGDLLALLPWVAGGSEATDEALVLAAYRAYGDRCAERLAGDFAFALFDVGRRVLLLARDIMAARPLFYTPVCGGIAFASNSWQLLAQADTGTRLDTDALADLVLNGYSDGRRTCFAGIHSVPPGALVIATPEQITTRQAWQFVDREIRYRDRSEYVDHFRALFTQAVERRLRGPHPVAVSVSGGVDSSAIYCEAARLRGSAALHAVRLAFPEGSAADESPFVNALRSRGLPVDDVAIDGVTWNVDDAGRRDDVPGISWAEHETMLARVRDAGCRVILNGFYGDQLLTGDAYMVDLLRCGRLGTVRRHLRERASWMTDVEPSVLRRRVVRTALRAATPAAMLPTIRRVRGIPASYPRWFTRSFRERAFEAAMTRAGHPRLFGRAHAEECRRLATSGHYLGGLLQMCSFSRRYGVKTAYPFRDRDLVQFVMSIPGDVANEGGVPKAILRRATDGLLPETIRLRRSKGDGTPFSNLAARAAEPAVKRLLGPDSAAARAGILDAAALRDAMPGIVGSGLSRSDSAEAGWEIGDTLALEMWLRQFFAGASWN